jgi:Mg2+-importing ATPase
VFGDIATRLSARPPESELERGLKAFGQLILRAVFFLVMFIVIVRVAMHEDPLSSVLFAVALAVGLTPELLPAITAVTLSKGAVRMAREKVIVKHLGSIQNLGSVDVLCSDKTGTLTSGVMELTGSVDALGAKDPSPGELARVNSAFETGIKSPLDAAIMASGVKLAGYTKLDEVPFDFERRRVSIVAEKDDKIVLITKGAPEAILGICAGFSAGGEERAWTDEARERSTRVYEGFSADGLRVLAVATRTLEKKPSYRRDDETDLVLRGFLAFSDPLLPDVANALRALKRDGVHVKILTGDNELVARHVCEQVGLDGKTLVLGQDLERMTDAALTHVAERTTVFARMTPAQKNRVILALKQRSHVVGFLGDGVNDAPSLHAADVGISVANAADIARDAADIILLERHIGVLHRGILEGRKSFGNVMKYILMGTSSNFGNMLSMAGAAAFLPFLPMLPTQILLNNLLYYIAQVTIPTDRVDASYIRRPQRWDIRTIRNFMLAIGPVSSVFDFATFLVLLYVFHASAVEFHTGWFVESLATQTLVVFVIRRLPGARGSSPPSVPLALSVIAVVLLGAALPATPLAPALGFTKLPLGYFAFLGGTVVLYLGAVMVAKRIVLRRSR